MLKTTLSQSGSCLLCSTDSSLSQKYMQSGSIVMSSVELIEPLTDFQRFGPVSLGQHGNDLHSPSIFLRSMPSVAMWLYQNQFWSIFWYIYQVSFLWGTWQGQLDCKFSFLVLLSSLVFTSEVFWKSSISLSLVYNNLKCVWMNEMDDVRCSFLYI